MTGAQFCSANTYEGAHPDLVPAVQNLGLHDY